MWNAWLFLIAAGLIFLGVVLVEIWKIQKEIDENLKSSKKDLKTAQKTLNQTVIRIISN